MSGGEGSSWAVCALNKGPKDKWQKPRQQPSANKADCSHDNRRCDCCGKAGHLKANCRFKDQKCHQCGRLGHLKAVCRSGKPEQQRQQPRESGKKVQTLTDDDLIYAIGGGRFHKIVRVNGRRVQMVYDTGADVSLINQRVFEALGEPPS